MDRKQFLNITSKGIALALISPSLPGCDDNRNNTYNIQLNKDFKPDLDVKLTSLPGKANILQGNETSIYSYEATLLEGADNHIQELPDTYAGPVFRVKKNQKIRVRYHNKIPQGESIIHWHGLHIPPEMDGHPMYAINEGQEYIYEFVVNNPPGTYWFHPHPDKITGPQVYKGLAGMFIVEDKFDYLPKNKHDLPVIIQDRSFDTNNQLVYLENNRMNQMQGFLGNEILINGKISAQQEVDRTAYRFRILNGSNSRIYKLGWSDNSSLTVIATDGGLLSKAVNKPYLMLSPGERVEVWKDFSSYTSDSRLTLKSLPFNDGSTMGMGGMMGDRMGGMMGNMGMQSSDNSNGQPFDLMQIIINDTPPEPKTLPEELNPDYKNNDILDSNAGTPRKFHFYNNRMQWVINGETFKMHEVKDWEKVKAGSQEIWEFINGDDGSGMGMMQNMMKMPHPVHIHGFSFKIMDRDTSQMDAGVWNAIKDGFVDTGWQDTFLLMPGMKVKILISFEDFTGKYIYHCHNLEHEDMGMMRNFEILS